MWKDSPLRLSEATIKVKSLEFLRGLFFLEGGGATAPSAPGSPYSQGFYSAHNYAPQSVGLLWTSNQLVAETSTWQHKSLTTDRHPWSRWDSKPQSQQASGRRPRPWTARLLGPAPPEITSTKMFRISPRSETKGLAGHFFCFCALLLANLFPLDSVPKFLKIIYNSGDVIPILVSKNVCFWALYQNELKYFMN